MSWKWRDGYIPIDEYVQAINKTWTHDLTHDLPLFPTMFVPLSPPYPSLNTHQIGRASCRERVS